MFNRRCPRNVPDLERHTLCTLMVCPSMLYETSTIGRTMLILLPPGVSIFRGSLTAVSRWKPSIQIGPGDDENARLRNPNMAGVCSAREESVTSLIMAFLSWQVRPARREREAPSLGHPFGMAPIAGVFGGSFTTRRRGAIVAPAVYGGVTRHPHPGLLPEGEAGRAAARSLSRGREPTDHGGLVFAQAAQRRHLARRPNAIDLRVG
jgi:hypothetical protein